MKVTIKVFKEDTLIITRSFESGVFRVGRSELSDLVVNDESLPRSLFEIRITESSTYVTNMGASGKLKIDGRKQETAEIKDGGVIESAQFKFVVLWKEESIQAEPQASPKELEEGQNIPADNMIGAENNGLPENALFGENPLGDFNAGGNDSNEAKQSPGLDEQPKAEQTASKVLEFPAQELATVQSNGNISEGNLALKEKTDTFGKPLVAKILVLAGPRAGEEIPLQSYELSFGRSSKADVVIADKKLSRVHAKIIRFGTGYRVIDLNSHNGTRVNGVRILEHPLNSFDVVEFGSTKLQFLIHDIIINEKSSSTNLVVSKVSQRDPTKSLFLEEDERKELSRLASEGQEVGLESVPGEEDSNEETATKPRSTLKLIFVVILAIGISYLVMVKNQTENPSQENKDKVVVESKESTPSKTVSNPKVPSDFLELTEEMQRRIEGLYNSALMIYQKAEVEVEELEVARDNLKKIHQSLPYYKNSKELLVEIDKRYRMKVEQLAAERAKKNAVEDLNIYLEDGIEYLKQGDFEKAAESFTLALSLDPRNRVAINGMRAAELKVRDLENLPVDKDPEDEKRQKVRELFERAQQEFSNRSYQEAIDSAEQIRKIILKGDQSYLNEAKQIIDRAKMAQKEEFEPFLIQAKEKYSEGDYNAARDLCDEMLKRDPAYEDAKELFLKAKKQLNRLAKEAYTHGYILESIGQIEQAKQYWNRAKNYVREGDDYFDKVNKKLEQYQ